MMSLYDLSVLTKTHGTKLFYDMLKQNKDVDTVIKIYDEYYGIDNLIKSYK